MRAIRYIGNGEVAVVEELRPDRPKAGLLVRTEACGLCSGELMAWYMDQKVPHILGHEVAGIVMESDDDRFPVGSRVFPHHHAPCLACEYCRTERFVHCAQWRRTRLVPGGMAEFFAVGAENLADTLIVDDLRPVDAALIEPLACVMKSVSMIPEAQLASNVAVVGLGVMGLMHALLVPGAVGYDLSADRLDWARAQGIDARHPDEATLADVVFVCPGHQAAFDVGARIATPGGTIVMFAPLGPGEKLAVPQDAYFRDLVIRHSYSCGPSDTRAAAEAIRTGRLRAEQVVSDFVEIGDLPLAYQRMKRAQILKPMVVFDSWA